jgi:hypothetical protein
VSAQDVLDWFNYQVFGMTTPTPEDRPTKRSNTILYWKKALSYYMPNRNHQWNELSNVGNPTKSQVLNDLVAHVKRAEVRG